MFLLYAIAGAIFNRIRGGWILPRFHDATNAIAFGLACYLFHGSIASFFVGAVFMWAGASIGWGRYIGATGGWENKPLEEFDGFYVPVMNIAGFKIGGFTLPPYIDTWAHDVASKFFNKNTVMYKVMWGFTGLCLRGMLWGFFLAIPSHSILPIFAGLLMGPAYILCIEFARKYRGNAGKGWEYGEFLFGGILWLSCFL